MIWLAQIGTINWRLLYESFTNSPSHDLSAVTASARVRLYRGLLERAGHEVQFIEGAFADTDDEVAQQVKAFGAEIVGISVMISYQSKSLALGRTLKEYLPDVPLVYGGPHPSVVPEDFVKEESVDYVNEM